MPLRNVRAATPFHDAKVAEPDNSRNPILQTGRRLRKGPYIIYIRTAETYLGYAMLLNSENDEKATFRVFKKHI